MNGENINYDTLFGVSGDDGSAEVTSEAQSTDVQGENAQELAGPDVSDIDLGEIEGDNSSKENTDSENQNGDTTQSKEENSKYAAARRQAEKERDSEVAKAKSEAEAYILDSISRLSLVDASGNAVTTKEQFEAYIAGIEKDKRQNFLDRTGFSEDELQKFIDNLPEVRKAKEVSQSAELAKAKANVDEQIRQISQINPEIKSLSDLTALPTYKDIYDKVKKGYSITDAYFVVHKDDIISKNTASARQAALNAASSKGHLEASTSRGTGAETVPSDIASLYRELDPGISDAEIRKHYNNYLKNNK